MQPMVGDIEKVKPRKSMYKRSPEGKKRTRSAKVKSMLWGVFTSEVHIVESLDKPDIHFHVQFNRSPS